MIGTALYQQHLTAFGRPTYLGMIGRDPETLDRALDRMVDLDRRWRLDGPGSELAHLSAFPGVALRVSADTLLLARIHTRQFRFHPAFYVDPAHQLVGLLAEMPQNLDRLLVPLAVELAFAELNAAGPACPAGSCVCVGTTIRTTGVSPSAQGWPVTSDQEYCSAGQKAA